MVSIRKNSFNTKNYFVRCREEEKWELNSKKAAQSTASFRIRIYVSRTINKAKLKALNRLEEMLT